MLSIMGLTETHLRGYTMDTDMTYWTEVTNAALVAKFSNACEIGRGFGIVYLEHPTKGDEAPVYAKFQGKIYNTNDFDI